MKNKEKPLTARDLVDAVQSAEIVTDDGKGSLANGNQQTKKDSAQTILNKNRLYDAMVKSLGIVTQACLTVKIDRSTFYEYYNKDAEFKKKIDSIQDIAIDFAEGKLMQNINKGDVACTIFYLKTKGKGRGYIERVETDVRKIKVGKDLEDEKYE